MDRQRVTIPVALQIVSDDYGWHNGRDGRMENMPSRSGIRRDHAPEDYLIVNEIGKAIDMKIVCPMVLGEWDKNNYLKDMKYTTYEGPNWNRRDEIDYRYAEKCFEAAENSEYVDYAYHALLHGYYVNGKQISETEYARPAYDEKTGTYDESHFEYISTDEMQEYIDIFYKIYNSWGFKKKITSFVAPCGMHTLPEDEETKAFSRVLRDNGFIHWANYWGLLKDTVAVIEGVTFMQKSFLGAGWEHYDIDPLTLWDQCTVSRLTTAPGLIPGAMGFHWTNFIRLNPQRNFERLPEWITYFKRQGAIFGQMLGRDFDFACSQAVYSRYAKITVDGNKCVIDNTDVYAQNSLSLRNEFYISFFNDILPLSCDNGKMSIYEKHDSHTTYKIEGFNKDKIAVTVK